MKKKMRNFFAAAVAVILAMGMGGNAAYAANTRASQYLSMYSAYITAETGGIMEIHFKVVGTGIMDKIGASQIIVQESADQTTWEPVETYRAGVVPTMTGESCAMYESSVSYQGTVGLYYRAYVIVYATKDGGRDSRQILASPVQARR